MDFELNTQRMVVAAVASAAISYATSLLSGDAFGDTAKTLIVGAGTGAVDAFVSDQSLINAALVGAAGAAGHVIGAKIKPESKSAKPVGAAVGAAAAATMVI